MRKDMEHIPAYILDWLEQKDFTALTAEERREVAQFFSEEEYTELHTVRQAIGLGTARDMVAGKEELKQDLIARLRVRQAPGTIRLSALAVWRAAAIVLFIISGVLTLYLLSFRTTDRSGGIIAATDTVYLNQDVAAHPIVIHDTFYIEKGERESPSYGQRQHHPSPAYVRKKPAFPDSAATIVAGPHHTGATEDDTKGSSIKDDSLMRKYSFVTL